MKRVALVVWAVWVVLVVWLVFGSHPFTNVRRGPVGPSAELVQVCGQYQASERVVCLYGR